MSGINTHFAASDALTAFLHAEDQLLASGSHALTAQVSLSRDLHHDYLRVAHRLESEFQALADSFTALGDEAFVAADDEHQRSYALSRAAELRFLSARTGEAWTLYEACMSSTDAEIVLELCEAGFADHARFIVTGEWAR